MKSFDSNLKMQITGGSYLSVVILDLGGTDSTS